MTDHHGIVMHAGDRVRVPWELDDVAGTVVAVDDGLGRAWVEVDVNGRPEPFSLPLESLTPTDEPPRPADRSFDPGLDTHQVLKPLLDVIGPDRPIRAGMLVTHDVDGNGMLKVEVTLLGAADQELPADQVLALHDRIRAALYEATDHQYVVVVRIGWREAYVA